MNWHHTFLLTAVLACAVAAVTDLRTGSIPNWLTLGLLAVAPIVRGGAELVYGHAWGAALFAVLASVAGAGLSALLPLLLWHGGGMGLGDVKLFAAIGATCGAFVGMYAQSYAYVIAAIYAVALLIRRKRLAGMLANLKRLLARPRGESGAAAAARFEGFTEIRFGPAILVGMCIAAWAQWRS
jgi:prepilin peptidase CpaA